jgi:hypothetical protein
MNKVARRPTNKIYVPKKKEPHGNKWKRVRKKYTSITHFLGLRSRHLYQFVACAYTQIRISIKAAFLFYLYILKIQMFYICIQNVASIHPTALK